MGGGGSTFLAAPAAVGPLLWLFAAGCTPPAPSPGDSRAVDSPPPTDSSPPGDTDTEIIQPSWPALWINELVADNAHSAQDGTAASPPWIELYNPAQEPLDLSGWTISTDPAVPDMHRLEQLTVPAGGFVLLWADQRPELGPDHLALGLSPAGGALAVYAPDGTPRDGLRFGLQATDHALARALDGDASWKITGSPSPGASNGGVGAGAGSQAEPPPACGLGSDVEGAMLLEGAMVQGGAACQGELGAGARIQAVSLPEGASWDGATLRWQTGPASAGRIELVFAVTSAGLQGETPLAETVVLWIADDPSVEDNVPVEPAAYQEEWALPVLHVATEGTISQSYSPAELVFYGRSYSATIKVRGASSAYYPKPGYTLEFGADELELPAWGVTRDHLVLVSPFDDNAYVRQKLVYDQWAAIASFWGTPRLTPRSDFVVLYLDGAYHGLYMALDRIDNEFIDQMGFDRDAALYKAVNHDANFFLTDSGGAAKDTLHDGYEKKEGEPEDSWEELEALVDFTGEAADAAALLAGDETWLDVQEFMDWFLLVHYAHAEDSAGKNAYLAFEPGQTLCRYAPWDFNHSWGQDWRTHRESSSALNTYTSRNRVFWAIQEDPAAEAELWERYRSMAQPGGPFDPDWLRARVDAYYARIEPSAQRDWERWSAAYTSYGGWASYRESQGDWTDYQGEKAYLYQWLDERAALFEARR